VDLFELLDNLLNLNFFPSARICFRRGCHFSFMGKYVSRRSAVKGGIPKWI
jgi:hypothetical protein